MRNLKKIDYFRKYVQGDKRQTVCGAALSLLTLALIGLFACFEFSLYLKPILNREVVLMRFNAAGTSESNSGIPVHIDLVLYHAPCESLYMREQQISGRRSVDPKYLDDFHVQRINPSGKSIPDNYISPNVLRDHSKMDAHLQQFLTQVVDKEGCHLFGEFWVDKSPGSVRIVVNWDSEEMHLIERLVPEVKSLITMEHKVNLYQFGSMQVQEIFADQSLVATEFDEVKEIPDLNSIKDCEYFMKVIPQKLIGNNNGETFQCSVHYKCSDESSKEGYQVAFSHEVYPIGIRYKNDTAPFSGVLISIVALLGGLYVIISILNQFINTLT